ncbi:hypothetical protein [Segatella copri]|uniref:Uncharacterized protein n=1 Tax=Segatella copri TaxID=165179 RepID=A0AAW5UUE7_9BACT|nr:hypothetical protein [Segatella copri]MCW4112678.1 hypothetical protein [Segatella copri]MCW4123161.1 hypothetical protein [Segatella copri]MCW4156930.1 hypothetical protein [Segatella copri]
MVKTIYDPCPVGFKIPEGDAFTGFSQENSTWNSDFAEKHFYTDASKTKIIVFKAAGVFEVNPVKLINVNHIDIIGRLIFMTRQIHISCGSAVIRLYRRTIPVGITETQSVLLGNKY